MTGAVLDRAAIDAILAAIEAAHAAPTIPGRLHPAVIGYNAVQEDADLERLIVKRGGEIIDTQPISGVGGTGGEAVRLHYRTPERVERWAYVIPCRLEIDADGEESLICSAPAFDDPDDLAGIILAYRESEQSLQSDLLTRLRAIDAEWEHVWPKNFFVPRALPWLLKDETRLRYTREVRDHGLEVILTWPDETLWEMTLKGDIETAKRNCTPLDETQSAREFEAHLALYTAAGLLDGEGR